MTYKLIELDPRELIEDARNVRTDHGDLAGMVATMQEVGVVQPIHVTATEDGRWMVLAGRRRTAAAIQAGLDTVPCLYRETNGTGPEDASADRIRSLVENVQRKDLNATEEAEGWRQLELAGLEVDAIAKVAGVAKERVAKGLAVGASAIATAVSRKYDLTLEQSVVLAEFDDDKEAIKELTAYAVKEPERFMHRASRMRQDREGQRALKAEQDKLTAKGVALFTGSIGYGGAGVEYLRALKDAETKKVLTPAAHKKCPGHAAKVTVDYQGKAHIDYVCTEPAKQGHKSAYGGSVARGKADDPKAAEKAKEERRKLLAENKEWRAAEPVRREFVTGLLKRRTAPAGVLAYVTAEILGMPEELAPMNRGKTDEMLTTLTGTKPGKVELSYSRKVGPAIAAKATTGQLPLALLAQVAAAREMGLDAQGARMARQVDARYLSFLAAQGYTLSEAEQRLIDKATKAAK